MNYRKIQKMASKKSKYKKITNQLKEILRAAYVQGELDPQGFRRVATIEELANDNQLSVNTLYKLALESKKFDSACLNIAKALLARVGNVIRQQQNANLRDFTPQQLDSMAGAALKTQKFAKLALGESTDNINVNGSIQENETFRRAMELLDEVENSRSTGSSTTH